jgi:cytochrome oxidase assembly protein ShyY1
MDPPSIEYTRLTSLSTATMVILGAWAVRADIRASKQALMQELDNQVQGEPVYVETMETV